MEFSGIFKNLFWGNDIEIIEPSIFRRRIFGGIDVEMAVKMVNEGGSNEGRRRTPSRYALPQEAGCGILNLPKGAVTASVSGHL